MIAHGHQASVAARPPAAPLPRLAAAGEQQHARLPRRRAYHALQPPPLIQLLQLALQLQPLRLLRLLLQRLQPRLLLSLGACVVLPGAWRVYA